MNSTLNVPVREGVAGALKPEAKRHSKFALQHEIIHTGVNGNNK